MCFCACVRCNVDKDDSPLKWHLAVACGVGGFEAWRDTVWQESAEATKRNWEFMEPVLLFGTAQIPSGWFLHSYFVPYICTLCLYLFMRCDRVARRGQWGCDKPSSRSVLTPAHRRCPIKRNNPPSLHVRIRWACHVSPSAASLFDAFATVH